PLDELHPCERFERQPVNRDDPAARTDPLDRVFRPAARRGAEIDHGHPGTQELVARIDLGELEMRPGAGALLAGALDVRIPKMALQPCTAALRARHGQGCGTAHGRSREPARSASAPRIGLYVPDVEN